MLNKDGKRELVYVTTVDKILPIEGADRVEQAVVGGWHIMVRKGQFEPGSAAIYFEIDSRVPETEPFKFLEAKNYKIKTQKYFKGKVISQGLLMAAEDFGWTTQVEPLGGVRTEVIIDDKGKAHYPDDESRFLTEKLGVTYAVDEDNTRKAASADKYKKMAQRNGKLFSYQPFRWLMKRDWGKKLLFLFFGKKKDKKGAWPAWIKKTDEERVQNMPWILENKNPWIATEKIDGTSTTFAIKRGKKLFEKDEFYICSRNVVFDTPEKGCYYDTNIYTEMAEKYNIKEVLTTLLSIFPCADYIIIQGETYGAGIQKRDYSKKDHDFMAFNLIMSHTGRWNTVDMEELLKKYNIPCVPIVDDNFILPDTVDELLDYATGASVVDGKMREGIVFRALDGVQSFKAVSNEFLLKYHQ
jgi:hypothetical protein